jgi:hypothetical protein
MQSLFAWLSPVACCVAIQGFWLGILHVTNPRTPADDLQNLHRLSGKTNPTLPISSPMPRV